jgi:hypothetical protein
MNSNSPYGPPPPSQQSPNTMPLAQQQYQPPPSSMPQMPPQQQFGSYANSMSQPRSSIQSNNSVQFNPNQPQYGFNVGFNNNNQTPYGMGSSPQLPPPQPAPMQQQFAATGQPQRSREEIFREIVRKYEINPDYAKRLQCLQGFKIVFVLDDSSSMNTTLDDSPLNNVTNLLKATRWDELKYFANISIDIASLFNENTATDLYFLNKPPIKQCQNSFELNNYFNNNSVYSKANGYTPLTQALNTLLSDNAQSIRERNLLIVILTDGEPTDPFGNIAIKEFKRCLEKRSPINKIFVTIIACTDEPSAISYLNKWDKQIPNLDVVDDYRSEKKQITKLKGANYRFSYGDYVVKSLIGSIDKSFDQMDERKRNDCLIS